MKAEVYVELLLRAKITLRNTIHAVVLTAVTLVKKIQ